MHPIFVLYIFMSHLLEIKFSHFSLAENSGLIEYDLR